MSFNRWFYKPKKRESIHQEEKSATEVFAVRIPQNCNPGDQFHVLLRDRLVIVTCPPGRRPGDTLTVTVPKTITNPASEQQERPPSPPPEPPPPPLPKNKKDTQLFEVEVPRGVQPGNPFPLIAGEQRILVSCPLNARPGDRIRFNVPKAILQPRDWVEDSLAKIRLQYNKDGWARNVRLTDMKFQWVRLDEKGEVDLNKRFDVDRSAYVRKLQIRHSRDGSRTGVLSLVPAADAVVDSCIKGPDGRDVITYTDIAAAQVLPFEGKVKWFQDTCERFFKVEWEAGHMQINVRRNSLTVDSLNAIMTMKRRDLRKYWKFCFLGEIGLDAGGLTREWFKLATEELFDSNIGLFQSSAVNQQCLQINPMSVFCCEGHLVYFRFLGRIMGRALLDRQLVTGHMVQHIYKHILGWPVSFADLERVDEEYYQNLKQVADLAKSGEDLSILYLDFTYTLEMLGQKQEIELVKDGSKMELDNENYPEYLEACLKYRMLGCVRDQLNEVLLGIFDVIPEPLLTIFDFQELELLMCGLPEIDVDDWRANTEYSGKFEYTFGQHVVCDWFWEVVWELDQETRARLLQFVTGTSGVPPGGFSCLQGNDGMIRKFTIHGVSESVCYYPRAHTCFNRIDLPLYDSKKDLAERLKLAITMAATGFDIE